jgi:hypothetical protein
MAELTHCSSCGERVRRDPIWGWTGHTWDCRRIGQEANTCLTPLASYLPTDGRSA